MSPARFPADFLFGVSTSAYQIEGSVDVDGRGPSIWDTWTHTPGKTPHGETGDVACDSYARWEEDVALLGDMGVGAYRFSIAWPRVIPEGRGAVNPKALDHYDRLVDALLARDITPAVTLYHWDLPQPLQDTGGWLNRDTVEAFGAYVGTCAERLGDRVPLWITQNEPWIQALLGYRLGLHPPGHTDLAASIRAAHHILLSHGVAVRALHAAGAAGQAGCAFSLFPHYPARDIDEDHAAAWASDGYVNRWFLDPVLRGSYPADTVSLFENLIGPLDFVKPGDLDIIATPSDFAGVNYYTTRVVRAAPADRLPWAVDGRRPGVDATDTGTEIVPQALTDLLLRLHRDYGDVPLMLTENGGVFNEEPDAAGRVRDTRRVRLLHDHLEAALAAIAAGVPLTGYFHWSLLDNFEWAFGYAHRFGLAHVDFPSGRRTIKDSGHYYAQVTASGTPPPVT